MWTEFPRGRLCGWLVLGGLLAGCTTTQTVTPFDLLIVNGTIYDGSGQPPRNANLGIVGARIASTSARSDAPAVRVIDADGLAVMPGFIDPHTHALVDLNHAERSANLNYLLQGVTTVVIGNDGRGLNTNGASFARLRTADIGTNVAFFAGHGAIRKRVLGMESRAPDAAELAQMQSQVAEAMRAGALGLSTGLYYAPGSYATTAEVAALARSAAEFGGVYDSHMRSEGSYGSGLLAAVDEVIEIGRQAGIPVHIAHIKALGSDVWGQSDAVIRAVNAARADGVDVTADQYPWEASGTRFSNALIPRWAMADSKEAMQARFNDPIERPRIDAEMQRNLVRRGGPEAMLVSAVSSAYRSMTLAQIAAQMAVAPIEAATRLALADDPSIASFVMHQEDIDAFAAQPWVMIGSDGSSGHPRKYATYPKAWRDFVVTRRLWSAAEFSRRASGFVADTLGLCDRGYLRVGRRADIAIIDVDNFRPAADYSAPTRLTRGVLHLLVNGKPVIDQGEWNGALPGELFHRQNVECLGAPRLATTLGRHAEVQ